METKTQVQQQAENMRQALRDGTGPYGRPSGKARSTVKLTAGDWYLIDHILRQVAEGKLAEAQA